MSKNCKLCKVLKPSTEFYGHHNTKDGLRPECKSCHKIRCDRRYDRNREEVLRKEKLRQKKIYSDAVSGIGAERLIRIKLGSINASAKVGNWVKCTTPIDELVDTFTLSCQLCDKYMGTRICLDHCHVTGRFRGWLCATCNAGIGYANESVDLLEKWIEYIKTR